MCFTEEDGKNVIARYNKRYNEFGYDPKSLGWDKGKQDIRFEILTSQYNFENKHVLDIGCGFGDLNKTLSQKASTYYYTGIDLVDSLLKEANQRFTGDHINFINSNILEYCTPTSLDYAISSGIFNHKLIHENNYEFIEAVINKSLQLVKDGIAFDFLSDKVDFRLEHTFHSSPEKILAIAYKYSKNIILRNDYMPFEFSLFIFNDDSFSKDDTVFNHFKGQ
jgi:2-polyprenyl-3-methyl-5-hydroxy-6-metoxy-1,4-benzoquinol methylase